MNDYYQEQGISDFDTVQKIKLLMNELNIDENFLKVVEVSKKEIIRNFADT